MALYSLYEGSADLHKQKPKKKGKKMKEKRKIPRREESSERNLSKATSFLRWPICIRTENQRKKKDERIELNWGHPGVKYEATDKQGRKNKDLDHLNSRTWKKGATFERLPMTNKDGEKNNKLFSLIFFFFYLLCYVEPS